MRQMDLIRKELEEHLGKKVILRADKGRKRYVTRYGVIKGVYPSLFRVDVINGPEITTQTYTYSDVLTKTVKVRILDDDVNLREAKRIS